MTATLSDIEDRRLLWECRDDSIAKANIEQFRNLLAWDDVNKPAFWKISSEPVEDQLRARMTPTLILSGLCHPITQLMGRSSSDSNVRYR